MRGKMIPRCCPACDATDCEGAWEEEEFEFNVTTSDLIAELERRRPCKRCEFKSDEYCECIWDVYPLHSHQDNFKEAI